MLLDGLKLTPNWGIRNIMVEIDSKIIVIWIKVGNCSLWYLWEYWDEIKRLFFDINCDIRYIFREANMVADYLAKECANNQCKYFIDSEIGRGILRGLLCIDFWGLPYLRL